MSNRLKHYPIEFKGVSEIAPMIKKWSSLLYEDRIYEHKLDGIDFFVDKDLKELSSNSDIIITKWGKQSLDTCFHCVTGYGLYEILPWWKTMQEFFIQDLRITPWLPYPCILISTANLRRHTDKGRPTAFNYPIFGMDTCTNHLWYDENSADEEYDETYTYESGNSILIDTSINHGGFVLQDHSSEELRAICNMGFAETFDICKDSIDKAFESGIISKIL